MAEQRKIRVAVVFGGRSSEHAISCITAGSVLSVIDHERYEVIPVGITSAGDWVLGSGDPEHLAITDGKLPEITADSGASLALPFAPEAGSFLVTRPGDGPAALGEVDVVLPLLHGPYGEDGTIQGLFEMVGTRYAGAGVFASAACMDKIMLKVLLAGQGFTVGPYVGITDRQWRMDRKRILEDVAALANSTASGAGTVGFVKPARAGSSVGITRLGDVTDTDAVVAAVESARQHDPRVLVEAAVEGREIECGVLEATDGGWPEVSVPAEIHVDTEHDFYDFEAKYLADSDLTIPAELSEEVTAELRRTAAAAFDAAGGEGLARVDFFYGADGHIYINEINTMPGFTPTSAFPQMWAASGLDYPTLVDRLLRTALARQPGLR